MSKPAAQLLYALRRNEVLVERRVRRLRDHCRRHELTHGDVQALLGKAPRDIQTAVAVKPWEPIIERIRPPLERVDI